MGNKLVVGGEGEENGLPGIHLICSDPLRSNRTINICQIGNCNQSLEKPFSKSNVDV